jgi:hypothetical protein
MDYTLFAKNSRLTHTVGLIGTAGKMVIGTAAMDGLTDPDTGVLVEVPLANPAFLVADGAMDVNSLPRTTTATGTGIAAKVEIRAGDDTVIMNNFDLGVTGDPDAEVIINALEISTGQTVQITIGTINHG